MKINYRGGEGILRKLKDENSEKSHIKTLNGERLLNIKKILNEGPSKSDTGK
jgi:hypothetical protein